MSNAGGQSAEIPAALGRGPQSATTGRGGEPGPGGEGPQRKNQPHRALPKTGGGGATAQGRTDQSHRPTSGSI